MTLIGNIDNKGTLQGQINSANGYLTGVISNADLLGGQIVAERGLKGEKGDTGNTGATGVGISSVVKTSSAGLVDTYTITYTNGNTTTFTVTNGQDGHNPVITASKSGTKTSIFLDGNKIAEIVDGDKGDTGNTGNGIASIAKTGSAGTDPVVDTYTVTYTNGDTDTFTVTNGVKGDTGATPVITATKVGKVTTVKADGVDIATINDGDDGHSPVVTASKTGTTTTIYCDGTAIATIEDGDDGVVQDVTVNGTSVLDGTTAKVLVPTKTSDLNNDSLFARGHIGAFHGTCTSSASATTKAVTCADFKASDLVAGAMILVEFSNTNSGAVADLKLDVNNTGAYAIKQNNSGTMSNLGDKGYLKTGVTYPFIFNGSYWITWYDTNTNTIGYTIRTNGLTLPVKTACYRYRICFTSPDGKNYVPANASTSTSATASKTVTTEKIDPFGRIIYYSYTTALSAGGTIGASYQSQQYNGVTLGYSFNRTGAALTMTANKAVYVKCAPQTDGSAIIDGTTPFVQDLPTTEDGKIYIFLGVATSATAIEFTLEHPVYYFKDGGVRQWTNASFGSGSVTDVTQNGTSVLDGTVAKVITHDVPSGGTSGQVLSKSSGTDYDLAWTTVSGGGDVVYATSSDTASTVAKTATIVSGTLTTLTSGVQAIVKFAETNTASSPTLNIGGTGAKSIKRYGTTAVGQNQNESWVAGSPVLFVYDGTNWVIAGWLNTTYSGGTSSGITTGTDNLNYIWSPKQIHDGIVGLADANVQSDWSEADNTKDDYIKNKPTIPANTSDLNNDSGFITSGDVPKEVYWATYGHTTSAEIETAYQAGKLVCVEYTDIVYVLSERYTSTRHYFGAVSTPYLYRAYCNNGTWSNDYNRYTTTPTAWSIAEFNANAKMNSTDMSSADVSTFVSGLNVSGGGVETDTFTYNGLTITVNKYPFGLYSIVTSSSQMSLNLATWTNVDEYDYTFNETYVMCGSKTLGVRTYNGYLQIYTPSAFSSEWINGVGVSA